MAQRTAEVSEAEIAVHWQEEDYIRPPKTFIAQANLKDAATKAGLTPEKLKSVTDTLNAELSKLPDHAKAHLLYRLVGPTEELRRQIVETVGGLAQVDFYLEIPFVRLRAVDGWPTMVAAFTTDIPALTNWGEPMLVGPGSIHVAHTDGEYVEKKQLSDAVELYYGLTKKLMLG